MADEATSLRQDDQERATEDSGNPVPATSATGTPSAGKHEPANPAATSGGEQDDRGDVPTGGEAAVSVTEVDDRGGDESAGPGEGTGGDAGSGPTGAVTPDDLGIDGASGSRPAALPIGAAAFIAGLITGVIAGWFAAR
jgi:hypothetical protein